MFERDVDVTTRSGRMKTFFASPSTSGEFPLVIIYMDVWGIREELRDVARRVARLGYCCALPDLYYREGQVSQAVYDEGGRMISLEKLAPEAQAKVRAPLQKLTDAMVMEDTETLLQHAFAHESARGGVGCVGYCMGGRHALVASGAFPDRFKVAVSLHGSNLVAAGDASPHRLAMNAKGELYCGFAEKDRFATPAVVETLDSELRKAGVRYRFTMHRGVEHGYALPDRDVFDPAATALDWIEISAILSRQLRPDAPASG